MDFEICLYKKKIKNPIFIEGLPGIGNVGKVAVDFIIDTLAPKKIGYIISKYFPHYVFIGENNLVQLPKIELFHKKIGDKDFVFMVGDVQPIDEPSCYEFCANLLNILKKWKTKEIVTIGGIGLSEIPKKPIVYITGNNKKLINNFKGCNKKIYGVVGPIVGVTGVLVGMAGFYGIPAVALLAQTYAHLAHLGISASREIMNVLNKTYNLEIDIERFDEEINQLEKELKIRFEKGKELLKPFMEKRKLNYFG